MVRCGDSVEIGAPFAPETLHILPVTPGRGFVLLTRHDTLSGSAWAIHHRIWLATDRHCRSAIAFSASASLVDIFTEITCLSFAVIGRF